MTVAPGRKPGQSNAARRSSSRKCQYRLRTGVHPTSGLASPLTCHDRSLPAINLTPSNLSRCLINPRLFSSHLLDGSCRHYRSDNSKRARLGRVSSIPDDDYIEGGTCNRFCEFRFPRKRTMIKAREQMERRSTENLSPATYLKITELKGIYFILFSCFCAPYCTVTRSREGKKEMESLVEPRSYSSPSSPVSKYGSHTCVTHAYPYYRVHKFLCGIG